MPGSTGVGEKDHFANLRVGANSFTQTRSVHCPRTRRDPKALQREIQFLLFLRSILFGAGARPSEIIALRWGDVDLKLGMLSINKSRYLGTDCPTETVASEREIALAEPVVSALKLSTLLDLCMSQKLILFLETSKEIPIQADKWRSKHWYRALRACNVRPRKFYATRHTFISDALSQGINIKWVAEYCGTSVAMIEKHYGRYIKSDSAEQLRRLFAPQTETLPRRARTKRTQVAGKFGGKKWSGRVDFEPHRRKKGDD